MTVRDTDRYVTPRVIAWGLLCATLVILGITAGVIYLTAIGKDPDPMLRLIASVGGAVASVGTLLLQLTGRSTLAKTERNTGVLASNTGALVETVQDAVYGPPVPPSPPPGVPPFPDTRPGMWDSTEAPGVARG